MAFIDMHKKYRENNGLLWCVEPICEVLSLEYGVPISKSGYYEFKTRVPSARTIRDNQLKEVLPLIYEQNYSCYGLRKLHRELKRQGYEDVARCTVERLMRELGLKGAVRGKVKRTTIAGTNTISATDLVKRDFSAPAPNMLWVADFTYVSTWEGWCYVAFIIDVFARRIVGHCTSMRMNQEMVATAFKIAVFNRSRQGLGNLAKLIHHNDKGTQYTADDFVELLAQSGVRASIGSVGDSYDNALAESINGSYKTELTKKFGPWKTFEQLSYETTKWVKWYNESRINEYDNYQSPNDVEMLWYAHGVDSRKEATSRRSKSV